MCTAASDEILESDCLGLSFWRVVQTNHFQTRALFKLTPMLFLYPGFLCLSLMATTEKQTPVVSGLLVVCAIPRS